MEPANSILEAIRARRSVRRFRADPVAPELIDALLDAARWAPSGLNNQPWRFQVVRSPATREALAQCTRYGAILRSAPLAVAVYLDLSASYHREKDLQSSGASVQNLMLAAHSLGLGTCWLGEILNHRAEAEIALGAQPPLELVAVIAVGHPDPSRRSPTPRRLPLEVLVRREEGARHEEEP